MVLRCAGLIVLRKPEFNFDELGRGVWPAEVFAIGKLLYSGVCRMEWFDLDEYYIREELSADLKRLHHKVHDYGSPLPNTLRDVDEVRRVLEFCNAKKTGQNEVAAVRGKDLDEGLGTFEAEVQSAEFLGWDVMGIGECSLIYEYVFMEDYLQRAWAPRLNPAGLLPDEQSCYELVRCCEEANQKGLLHEPLLPDMTATAIRLWRVVL